MSAFLLLLGCLGLGVGFRRAGRLPARSHLAFNAWVLYVALPALVLHLIPRLEIDARLWYLIVSQWCVFGGAWMLFAVLGRWLGWSRARVGCLTLVCGLSNTSFVGYPLIEALRGAEGLALGVVADQAGCFVALTVGGVMVAALYSGSQPRASDILRRVLLFPSFGAFLVGVAAGRLGGWPEPVDEVLARLGYTLAPLALFSVGLQFRLRFERALAAPMALGLGWKLLAAPALVFATGVGLGLSGLPLAIGTLQAAMAPMISGAILAEQHDLEPRLATAVLGVGILLSLISVPIANRLLG